MQINTYHDIKAVSLTIYQKMKANVTKNEDFLYSEKETKKETEFQEG